MSDILRASWCVVFFSLSSSGADMAVVIILSHGQKCGEIVCSDGNTIDVEDDVYR
jgi:hypothetical protein